MAMCITNAMGWLIIDWHSPRATTEFVLYTIAIVIGYAVLWFYWKGRNWARWLVLLTCVLCFYNLFFIGKHGRIADIMVLAEAGIAVFLIVWLNTRTVRAYFHQ